ncbi:MAG: hypothetical protein ACP5PJ_05545 [Acidimicrobiales bacterium]
MSDRNGAPMPIESEIIARILRVFLLMVIPLAVICFFIEGLRGLYSSLYAMGLVAINFFVTARILRYAASISPVAIMAGALGSFLFDLILLTVGTLPVARASWMSIGVFAASLIISYAIPVGAVIPSVIKRLAMDGLNQTWRRKRG